MKETDRLLFNKAVFNRPDDSNKGTLGSLLCICGSYGMAGAAIMAGKAALRCGIGLLKIAVPKSIYPVCAKALSPRELAANKVRRLREFPVKRRTS